MAYALVRVSDGSSVGTGETSIEAHHGQASVAGNVLVAAVWYTSAAQRTVTLSGHSSPTWVSGTVISGNGAYLHTYYALAIPGGGTFSLTATFGVGVDYPAVMCGEYSGLNEFILGQILGASSASTTSIAAGSTGSLSKQPAAIITLGFDESNSNTLGTPSGYTSDATGWTYGTANIGFRLASKRVTTLAAENPAFSISPAQPAKAVTWVFAEPGATGGGAAFVPRMTLLGVG